MVFVLFIPGFVAVWAVFPRRSDIPDMERLAFSMGLSIALSTLPVLLFNYLGVPLDEVNVFLILVGVTLVCGLVAMFRIRKAI